MPPKGTLPNTTNTTIILINGDLINLVFSFSSAELAVATASTISLCFWTYCNKQWN